MAPHVGTITGTLVLQNQFTPVLNSVAASVGSIGSRLSRALNEPVRVTGLQVAAITASVGLLGKSILDNVSQAQQVMAQLEAAVISTGGAAGRSAEQIAEMAEDLSKLTGVEDEVIAAGQSLMLMFTRIGRDVFPRASAAALDLSRRTGKDVSASFQVMGRALNDPIKGVMTLERSIGRLPDSLKKSIASFTEHGRIAEAHNLILTEVERRVGGAAKAFRDTLPGAISALKNSWGNLLEEVGKSGDGGGLFRTGIEGMVDALDFLADNWGAVEAAVLTTIGNISSSIANAVAFWLGLFEKIVKAAQAIQSAIPDIAGFGLAGKTQKLADDAVSRISGLRNSVKQFGDDLKEGFGQKAEEAIERSIRPAKELDESLQGLDDTIGELSGSAAKSAEEFANLAAELRRSASQKLDLIKAFGLGDDVVDAVRRSHELHNAYLRDVAKFGKAAADALQPLRRADIDLEAVAKKVEKAWKGLSDINEDFLVDLPKKLADVQKAKFDESAKNMLESLRTWHEVGEDMIREFRAREIEKIDVLRETEMLVSGPYKQALLNAQFWFEDYIARIEDAQKRGVISSQQAADAIIATEVDLANRRVEIARERTVVLVSDLSGFFDFLSDEFGGLFNYISDLLSSIQKAQQAGSSMGGMMTGLGASAGTASTAASVVTVLGIWKAIYDIGMDILRTNKSKKFGQAGTVTVEDGVSRRGTSPGVGQVSSDAIRAIEDVIKAFEDALRISVDDLAEIGIKLRNDGKKIKAYVAGQFIGEFNDVMEAITSAFSTALTSGLANLSNIPDLMKEGLANLPKTKDLDSVIDFLAKLKDIGDLGLSQGALAVRDATRDFDSMWDALEKFKTTTPAVQQAFDNLNAAEGRLWQNWLDSITGREKTAAELLADKVQELAIFKVELALRKALIAQRVLEVQASIAAIKAGRTLIGGTGGGGTSPGGASGGVLGVAKAFSVAGSVITQTAIGVTAASITLSEGALAMIAALEAEAAALLELQKLLDALVIPEAKDIRLPKRGGDGADTGGVDDFIRDKTFELSLAGLSDYLRALEELDRQYEELLEQAGRDLVARQKLLDLKERELALLAKEQKESVADRFKQFLGLVTPFDSVRKTAEELIKSINESPFGDERKARMIQRILEDVERQLDQLARQAAAGILGQMSQDLEKFGADEKLLTEVRRNLAILEHTLRLIQYEKEIALLKAEGKIADEIIRTMEDAFDFLKGIDPTKFLGGNGPTGGPTDSGDAFNRRYEEEARKAEEMAKKIADATRALEQMEREALDPLTRDLLELNDTFRPIKEAFGETERVMKAFAQQTEEIMRKHFGAIIDLIDGLDTSELSPMKTIDKFKLAQKSFDDAIKAVSAGDYRKLKDIPNLFEEFLSLAKEVTPGGSSRYRELFERGKQDLLDLVKMTGLTVDQLTTILPSGVGFGNLLVPEFGINPPVLAPPIPAIDPVVAAIGNHSDRQIIELRSMREYLDTISIETGRTSRGVAQLNERAVI